jgi:hypothetical protein
MSFKEAADVLGVLRHVRFIGRDNYTNADPDTDTRTFHDSEKL